MDSFRRYCKAYLTTLHHPFDPTQSISLSPQDLDEAMRFVLQILTMPVSEHRLKDLDIRFRAAFDQYLIVSRDQAGALTNAVERLVTLLEPYLKKLVFVCYPRRVVTGGQKPLYHLTLEPLVRELGLAAANMKRTDDAYWKVQPVEDAHWRIACASRHKGSHEAHGYGLVDLERIAKTAVGCLVLAAWKVLRDPSSKSREILAASSVARLEELLTARADTYYITQDLPDRLEHLRFYEARAELTMTEAKARLLFESFLV